MFEIQTRKNKAYRTVKAFQSFDAAAFYLSRHVGTDVDRRIVTRNGDRSCVRLLKGLLRRRRNARRVRYGRMAVYGGSFLYPL